MDTERVDACPVCGGRERRPLYVALHDRIFAVAPATWDLHCCLACGAAFLDPRPAPHSLPDAYACYYTHVSPQVAPDPAGVLARARRAIRNGYGNARFGYELRPATRLAPALLALAPGLRAIVDRTFRHLPRGDRLLDVGCGAGDFVAHAAQLGWRATGIDIDGDALALGRQAGFDLRVERLSEHDGHGYDAITMSHVIEHVSDPVSLLAAARERLRPGGVLWIATPNLRALGHRRFGRAWVGLDPPRHLVLFTSQALERALTAAGFTPPRRLSVAPNAHHQFALSAAVARGERLDIAHPGRPRGTDRWRAALAEQVERRVPEVAEELVALAQPAEATPTTPASRPAGAGDPRPP